MNSRAKFILGFFMLLALISVAGYYVYSGLTEDKSASENKVNVSEVEPVKNYMSAMSANEIILSNKDIPVFVSLPTLYEDVTLNTSAVFDSVIKETESEAEAETETEETKKEREYIQWDKEKSEAIKETVTETEETENAEITETASEAVYKNPYDELFAVDPAKITDYLNIREVPNGKVVGIMYPASWGYVVSEGDGWTEIISGGVHGYIDSQYIIRGIASAQGRNCRAQVLTETLNLRQEAVATSHTKDVLLKDSQYIVLGYENGWVYVQKNDMYGYLYSEHVKFVLDGEQAIFLTEELTAQLSGKVQETQAPVVETTPAPTQPETVAETAPAQPETVAETAPAQPETVAETTPAPAQPETTAAPTLDEQIAQQIAAYANSGMANESPVYLSYSDIYLMACVISIEDGWGTDEGKLAVANCLINRLKNGHWGNTMTSVVYAPGQFYGSDGPLLQGWLDNGPRPGCMEAAIKACAGINILGDYMYFCSTKSAEDKYQYFIKYINIDGNVFYYRIWG